jgi:transglutaminase-like putative cysteine protease
MHYTVRHETRFRYSQPISESVMEVYMQPRSEATQRCLRFKLLTNPQARVFEHYDYLGNMVHSFDIQVQHKQLHLIAESLVEMIAPPPLPESLGEDAWDTLDAAVHEADFWDILMPSPRTEPTEMLNQFAQELDLRRRTDPLQLLREITAAIYQTFDYDVTSTEVDSPMDVALEARRGVCQDFTHVMTALVRGVGIPCRYVSGYLFNKHGDRSIPDASHAWVEAYLPQTGWIGFDPTNNLLAGERHVRVAVGRDYNDVPPTRGIFRGGAETELEVAVHVTPTEAPFVESLIPVSGWYPEADEHQAQQQ